MNEAGFRTLSRYLRINKQDLNFRLLTTATDQKRCMKEYNVANQKSQLSTVSKYAEYAKHARFLRTCI